MVTMTLTTQNVQDLETASLRTLHAPADDAAWVGGANVGDPVHAFAEHRDQIALALVVGHHDREGDRAPLRRPRTSRL